MRRAYLPLLLSAAQAVTANFVSDVQDILSRPTFTNATVGIQVRDLQDTTIYTHNADVALIPASNQKLVTSSAAFTTLGLDFTYKTSVFGTSEVNDGVLDGDIWIVGSGDPSLTSSRLREIAKDLMEEKGLREITGKVYGDGTIFDNEFLGEGWDVDDESFEYSAQVAGLNCDLNAISVKVAPGATVDDAPIVQVNGLDEHHERYTLIQSSAKTAPEGKGNSIVFSRTSGTNTIVLGGSIALDASPVTIRTTVHDPIAFTAYRFALALKEVGVTVSGSPTKSGKLPKRSRELACSISEPFAEVLKQFMKPSQNMYGEALLKTMGRAKNSHGSASSGAKVVGEFLKKAKVHTGGVNTVDGSGLSRMNTLTARAVCDILRYDRNVSEREWKAYFDSLPIAGVDGTLSDRFQNSPAKGHVRGKTGSLTGVSALSGYVSAEDGREYIFSILMNDYSSTTEARQAQDDIATALYGRKE